jgi:hypothetical protein
MPAIFFLILLGFIVALMLRIMLFMRQRRTQDMAGVAQKLSLQFYPEGSNQLSPLLANLAFFSWGKYKRITNLMMGKLAGKSNISVAIFDYRFAVNAKEGTKRFSQSVVLFFVQEMLLPQFYLHPVQGVNKLGHWIGFRPINFPNHPDFAQKYHLISNEELPVRQLFHPELIEFLEEENFYAEANGAYLVLYSTGEGITLDFPGSTFKRQNTGESRFLQPEEIFLFLDTGTIFLRLLQGGVGCIPPL